MFTLLHVGISLVGIGSGLVVAFGLLTSRRLDRWTTVFLTTTVATSVTGFMIPADRILPSHVVGAVSLVVLAVAIAARSVFHLVGAWRPTYVATAVVALHLNVFVLIVQLFQKVPVLRALAPTQSEPPFAAVQISVFLAFLTIGVVAARNYRIAPPAVASGNGHRNELYMEAKNS
jgi:hypothetical protein